jgi:SEC-C motif-containing protein
MDGLCPCGSAQAFADCCGPFLSGEAHPATAVALMRSRYTAYGRRDAAYLLRTWHLSTRPEALDFSQDDTVWVGLTIISQTGGGPDDEQGEVEFSAAYRQGGVLRRLRENSRFIKASGVWLYVDGAILPDAKPGRNDPCPCGSGKKYKKCCG